MIFEFFGLPGSGKTYLSNQIYRKDNIKIIGINNRAEKYFFVCLFAVRHFKKFTFFLNLLYKENKFNKKLLIYKIKHLFFQAISNEQKARFYRKAIVDHGIFSFLLSIHERKISSEDLFSILKNLHFQGGKYKMIIVEADKAVRKHRMDARGRLPRKNKFGLEYFENWLEIVEYNYSVIKKFIIQNFSHQVIINNENIQ